MSAIDGFSNLQIKIPGDEDSDRDSLCYSPVDSPLGQDLLRSRSITYLDSPPSSTDTSLSPSPRPPSAIDFCVKFGLNIEEPPVQCPHCDKQFKPDVLRGHVIVLAAELFVESGREVKGGTPDEIEYVHGLFDEILKGQRPTEFSDINVVNVLIKVDELKEKIQAS